MTNLLAFVKEYEAQTVLASNAYRVWKNEIFIELKILANKIHLSYLGVVNKPQKGFGSKAMKWLTELADKHQVEITGTIEPIGEYAMPFQKLCKFYAQFDFVPLTQDRILRGPKRCPDSVHQMQKSS